MKIYIALLFSLLSIAAHAETFILKKGKWTAQIQIAHCDANECRGETYIHLNTGNHKQTFYSEDLSAYRSNPNTPFNFDDFVTTADYNFDGKTDIAISQGNYGSYNSAIYNIYVQTTSGKFILSEELSDLTINYMGLPDVDKQNKQLIVFRKSGAAYNEEVHYRVRQNQNPALQQVYFKSTEHNSMEGKIIETTEILKNGKIHKSVKTYDEN